MIHFEYAVLTALLVERCFKLLPGTERSAAQAAMNDGSLAHVIWDIQINNSAFFAGELEVKSLGHDERPPFPRVVNTTD